ncbi:MAG: Spo0E family sporulation regulatory protein-aspartic acid phosphatase [Lentisphaerae bacterium]|nr:Spo0E family sporulation regulatory protein-aspartic acid phosphatase [Lentisphaerota bacterium]
MFDIRFKTVHIADVELSRKSFVFFENPVERIADKRSGFSSPEVVRISCQLIICTQKKTLSGV